MKKQGFLLGLFSVGGQVLLLRELVSSLNGDELFIGTALFGWLMAVAFGAYMGGKSFRPKNPNTLLIIGALLLPVMIIAVRWSPVMVTSVTGEIVPFAKAALISVIAMFPIGIISGWLFPLVTRRIIFPASDAVVRVYLFEGIGAFAGGLIISLLVLLGESTLLIAAAMGMLVLFGVLTSFSLWVYPIMLVVLPVYVIIGRNVVWYADCNIEHKKNSQFNIETYRYSPYGKHLLLERDDNLTLLTDNTIESNYPDREAAENQFFTPFIYRPSARRLVYVGEALLMTGSLDKEMPVDTFTAVDPRICLSRNVYRMLNMKLTARKADIIEVRTDPVDYFTSSKEINYYDIVILNTGQPDNYLNSRYFTTRFLQAVKRKMADSSVLSIPLAYDTDRYLTPETQKVLSIIHATLSAEFANVTVWPGTTTIFLASDRVPLNLSYNEIIARLIQRELSGDYISDAYLFDRLSEMKVERLLSSISGSDLINTVEKPVLTHYQALNRARVNPVDRAFVSFIIEQSYWMLLIPAAILWLFVRMYRRQNDSKSIALFLYFVAGVVSLSLELISFYLYQTTAGSLYAEMSLLIGSFMLGLAVGTYYSHKVGDRPLQYPALIILLAATIMFLTTWHKVGTDALLIFHTMFLFVIAIATGTLFVAASNIYYGDEKATNRGIGYAWEIAGSAVGALLTLTVLLPVIGITWLLISLAVLIILALAGSFLIKIPAYAA